MAKKIQEIGSQKLNTLKEVFNKTGIPVIFPNSLSNFQNLFSKLTRKDAGWDIIPNASYFAELFRVSKNQIIWGGNYFAGLPPTRGFIIWDKKLTDNWTLAMAEFAWTSFDKPSKIYRGLTDNGSRGVERIHICQKPIKLYEWCLKFYAKEGDLILDTHL